MAVYQLSVFRAPLRRLVCAITVLQFAAACGGGSPTSPTPITTAPPVSVPAPITPPAPVVTTVTVAGVLTDAQSNRPVGGATVRIGTAQSSTDGNGYFSIGGVAPGAATISASATNYNTVSESFTVATSDTRRDLRIVPFWTTNGVGNTVFDMPTYVRRVRIIGTYNASGSNFIVWVGTALVVNEIIGTGRQGGPRYEGVHAVTGGVVRIENSRDVIWSFAQTQ